MYCGRTFNIARDTGNGEFIDFGFNVIIKGTVFLLSFLMFLTFFFSFDNYRNFVTIAFQNNRKMLQNVIPTVIKFRRGYTASQF